MFRVLTIAGFVLFANSAFAAPAPRGAHEVVPNPITEIRAAHRVKLEKLKAAHFTRIETAATEAKLWKALIKPVQETSAPDAVAMVFSPAS